MPGVACGEEMVRVVEELSSVLGWSKDTINRVLYKRFSEDLVEVSHAERRGESLEVWIDSRVLSVSELRTFWSDFRKELAAGVGSVCGFGYADASRVSESSVSESSGLVNETNRGRA